MPLFYWMQAAWSTLLSFDYNIKSPTIPDSGIIGEIFEYMSNIILLLETLEVLEIQEEAYVA